MNQLATKEHKHYFDYLRVLASLMVIMIHVTASPYIAKYIAETNLTFFSHLNLVMAFGISARSSVPLFFMMSGALLLNPSYNFSFKKSFLRLAFPLVIWSGVGALLANHYIPSFNFKEALLMLPSGILNRYRSDYNIHFWYVYALIGFYLIMPILKKMTSSLEQKDYQHLLLIWLVFSVLSPSISYYLPLFILSGYQVTLPTSYLGYLFLGYYLDKYAIAKIFANNKIITLMLGLLIIVLLVPWGLTWQHNLHATKLVSVYFGNFNIFLVLQTICFFMLAKHLFHGPSIIIVLLSKLSFTAYCCHIIVRLFLNRSPLLKPTLAYFQSLNPTAEVIFKFTFVAIISYLIAYLLSLLPQKISFYFGI